MSLDPDFPQSFAFVRTSVPIDEIARRVGYALSRHPLCREVEFDIMPTPRGSRGVNWTVSLRSVAPGAIWEAADIVADIQDVYDLAVAA